MSSPPQSKATAAYCDVFAGTIPLEEALEDSPMFRKRLKDAEIEVDDFTINIKKIVKAAKTYQTNANAYENSFKDFINEVVNMRNNMGVKDELFDKNMNRFTNGLKEIANYQEFLFQQMEGLVSNPLQDFINTDVKSVKEHAKKHEKATGQLDSLLSKLGQVKKKNSQKVGELEQELESTKKQQLSATLELVNTLNTVLARKKFEFLERVCVYMHAQMTYFHQGYELFKDLEPHMKQFSHYLQSTRKDFEAQKKTNAHRKSTLQENPTVTNPKPAQQSSSPTLPVLKKGYLFKRSVDDVINTWSRKYFVLKDGQLLSYKTGKEEQPDQVIPLLLCTVRLRVDLERRNCFELVSPPDKSFLLQAENEDIMHEWIHAIQNTISNLLNAQPSQDDKNKRSSKPSVMDGADTPLSVLRDLSPANCVCADCDAKDPDWASINLGAILCIDCSGIHRSLGVHISKVRSLSLDQWEPDLLELMSKLGNEVVNKTLEAVVPLDCIKPTSCDSWDTRQKWIRNKYEKRAFVRKFQPSTADADEQAIKKELNHQICQSIVANDAAQILCLMMQGADVNYQNPEDNMRTPVFSAITSNNPPIASLLLMNGASADVRDSQGWTPLHLAAHIGQAKCAVMLLLKNSGGLLRITDNAGHTALDVAMEAGSADCVTLFRLAQLAKNEDGDGVVVDSFNEALRQFSRDARRKS